MIAPVLLTNEGAANPRAFLSGCIAMAAIHLEHADAHVTLGDSVALVRSMRKFAACAKAICDTLPEAVQQIEKEGGSNV